MKRILVAVAMILGLGFYSPAQAAEPDHVLAISVDGLNTKALTQLGRAELPNFWRLLDEGKSTLNARTTVEKTVTLPNHTSMVTSERVNALKGGHGVTINDDTTRTVHDFAGQYIYSVFDVIENAGWDSAVYAGKSKFSLFPNSWASLDKYTMNSNLATLVTSTQNDLVSGQYELIFLHMRSPDEAGHRYGWMTSQYLTAVRETDAQLGRLFATIDANPAIKDSLSIVLTADHGGIPGTKNHGTRTNVENYRIPFLAWGAGVTAGDIYARNLDDFRNPGTALVTYQGVQPVRNANLANLSLDLLGLGAVPNSGINPAQTLDVD